MLKKIIMVSLLGCFLCESWFVFDCRISSAAKSADYEATPPFMTTWVPPLVMLVMDRDHTLYQAAYNDASDLNGDGELDVGYNPTIDYYGYFDSYKGYTYSAANGRFEPTSQLTKPNKTVTGANEWSGDFLNYLTMSRMDCLRKVLYGGYRSTDTATETVLKRAYIPQDAHTWGKEYESVAVDGYDIRDYTPLDLPTAGTRHLFCCTALSDNGDPLLRVLPNNTHRIWEWVSKERPEGDSSLVSAGGHYSSHPNNHSEFDTMITLFANAGHLEGSRTIATIDGSGAPPAFDSDSDYYMDIFTGTLNITATDTYQFAVDGDDAVEVIIDGTVVAGWYGGHGNCGTYTHSGSITLSAGSHTLEFRHEEMWGGDNWYLWWNRGNTQNVWEKIPAAIYSGLTQTFWNTDIGASTITDYKVYVKVAVNSGSIKPEDNCKLYPNEYYKPIGLLQRYGESGRMHFGLITGSYTKNTSGGVLRKNIGPITDEINPNTGEFLYIDGSTADSIIKTIDQFRILDYDFGSYYYNNNCGWITTREINEGECRMWGNPIAEMMFEALRYFSGAGGPTAAFDYNGADASLDDNRLGLPKSSWVDPYDSHPYCAKPFMLVLSDINPSFDSDQLPGSYFSGQADQVVGSPTNDPLNVDALADMISNNEGDIGAHFIGQANATTDGACTVKNVTGFGEIRGLCPEDPTKRGSYYSPAVAYYGRTEDIHANDASDNSVQNVSTYVVALAPSIPRISIPIAHSTITLVPFGKSVGGCMIDANPNGFRPTNGFAGLFVEEITDTYGKFRINFEDVPEGSDNDMDAIVEYEYQVVDGTGNPVADPADGVNVVITLNSTYAAGCIIQHMGYIISGTTADGIYLEVRDVDTAAGSDVDYVLDTPNVPGALPLTATRTFSPGATPGATLLKDPLWYAAKWGGFEEDTATANNIPDQDTEWDKDGDGVPDTYFYVQNPLQLESQLNRSFASILQRVSSGTAASVISQSRSGEGAIYQAVFYPQYTDPLGNEATWAGDVRALFIDDHGNMREDTNGNHTLDTKTEDRNGNGVLDPGEDKNGNGLLDGRDLIIVYDGTTVRKYDDANENSIVDSEDWTVFNPPIPAWYNNGVLDTEDTNGNGILDPGEDLNGNNKLDYEDANHNGILDTEMIPGSFTMQDIKYLWSASRWLNELTDTQAITQRAVYNSDANNRYIFTFVDENENMVVDPNEIVPFECPALPGVADLTDTSKLYPYLTLFPTFDDEPAKIGALRSQAVFTDYLRRQTQRVINYVRGQDQGPETFGSYIADGFRSRRVDYDNDGTVETWRLGDVIYSTPTVVGRPAENLHLLYTDVTYAAFDQHYLNRRQVVYAGANDGMLHAFNGGFFNNRTDSFELSLSTETPFELGAEMWAYVPYNLLPHLYWLTESGYPHTYYCDLKPKVVDAKIFTPDADHPFGWGTVLVVGMRLGGGNIQADMDKTDGPAFVAGKDRTMTSAYMILDITNPEVAPRVLAEISFRGMGYTTCYPAVITMKDKDPVSQINDWYLVIGSGPAKFDGTASNRSDLAFSALIETASEQPAKLFIIDLVELGTTGHLRTIRSDGSFASSEPYDFLVSPGHLDNSAFVSALIAVDYNLDYRTDAVYFGTVSGDESSGWGGKMRRLVINNDRDVSHWIGDNTLIDLTGVENGQPITAEPNVGFDADRNKWVYFGTGRFMVETDRANTDQQSYYGIKEPVDADGQMTWAEVSRGERLTTDADKDGCYDPANGDVYFDENGNGVWDSPLLNVTNAQVDTNKTVLNTCDSSISNWSELINSMNHTYQGWYLNFLTPKERNLGQATLLGDLLTFTTYVPSLDICSFDGNSLLYGLYYTTGTAYYTNVFGLDNTVITSKISLGGGLAESPNIHMGRGGTEAMIQTSNGPIIRIKQEPPGNPKSGVTLWEDGCN